MNTMVAKISAQHNRGGSSFSLTGGLNLDKGTFHWNVFIFKGFLLQSNAYWAIVVPQYLTDS